MVITTEAKTDAQLLQEYAKAGDACAFSELVRRHLPMVRATARRSVRDAQLADDVTQAVLIILARRAGSLQAGTSLAGWLFQVTRYTASNAIRIEMRHRKRQQVAARERMEPVITAGSSDRLDLDQVVDKLPARDREAIVLRFYEGRSLEEVGCALGVTRDAAAKRIARAVDRLRVSLGISAEAVPAVLVSSLAMEIPADLAVGLGAKALAATTDAAAAPSASGLAADTIGRLVTRRAAMLAGGATAVLIGTGGIASAIALLVGDTDSGTSSPPEDTNAIDAAPAAPDGPLDLAPLSRDEMKQWWIEPGSNHFSFDESGDLIVHSSEGEDAAFRAEVGGMSLDHYRVSVEAMAEHIGSTRGFRGNQFPWNVQFCPNGTRIFCQFFGSGHTEIGAWFADGEPHHRRVVSQGIHPIPAGEWHRFEMLASSGVVTTYMDGRQLCQAKVDIGTRGLFGLLVNYNSDAVVRLRNFRLTLLRPTPEQLRELQTDAVTNWERFVESERKAGTAVGMEGHSTTWPGNRPSRSREIPRRVIP